MRLISEMLEEGMDMADLMQRVTDDFKFFYERVLGFDEKGGLNEYKKEWFNLAYENDYVMIKAPSGFAKTTVLGVAFPIWWVLTHQNIKILLISKSLTQSKDALLLQIRDLIDDNEFLKKALKPEERDAIWNQTQIKIKDNSSIINRPYSINLKGYRAHIILLDEIDSYEDPDIFFDHVLSRLIPGGKIIGISTPEEGTTTLMELIKLRSEGACVFKTYTAIVDWKGDDYSTGRSIWEEEYPIPELMKRKKAFGNQKWMKNYMCDAMTEDEKSIYSAESIEACKDYELGFSSKNYGGEIYIGCDFALSSSPTGDYDAYVVIEKIKDTATIKYAEVWKGVPVDIKVQRLQELNKRFNPISLICDKSGIGPEIIRQLRIKGLNVEEQSFQSGERNILLNNLKALLDNHKIVIPKERDDLQAVDFANTLEYELYKFKEIKSKLSGATSYVSKGTHDDTVMGLAMALKHVQLLEEDLEDSIGVANEDGKILDNKDVEDYPVKDNKSRRVKIELHNN